MDKRGVSQLIGTTILVAIVIVASIVVWTYFGGVLAELVLKNEKTTDAVCRESVRIKVAIDLEEEVVLVENTGNVPLAGFFLTLEAGKVAKRAYFACSLFPGETTSENPNCQSFALEPHFDKGLITGCKNAIITPVLRGTGQKSGSPKLSGCEQQSQRLSC